MLARTLQRLEDTTAENVELAAHAAESEAEYRHAQGYKVLAIIESGKYGRGDAKERDARIEMELTPERKAHLHAQAALESNKEALRSLRARLAALQVISASVRTGAGT